MKKVKVQDAIGMTLCHDITAMVDGFKGAAFKRGHVITQEDIPRLLDIGKQHVFIWEENAGEIHEEDAARRLSQMTTVNGAHYGSISEGKVQLFADQDGMFRVDKALLAAVNRIGDITITTLPDHYPVKAGDRLASMRIVPLVTEERQIAEAEALCADKQLYDLRPFKPLKVGIIITGSEIYHGRIKDKFERVARAKLAHYPAEILGVHVCDDELDMIVGAGRTLLAEGAELLIFSGGMSVDPDDLTPSAIREMGAEIVSYGVPSRSGCTAWRSRCCHQPSDDDVRCAPATDFLRRSADQGRPDPFGRRRTLSDVRQLPFPKLHIRPLLITAFTQNRLEV